MKKKAKQEAIPNRCQMFMHCTDCLNCRPQKYSPREWARNEVGVTLDGKVQVWCVRHEKHVAFLDPEECAQILAAGCSQPHVHT